MYSIHFHSYQRFYQGHGFKDFPSEPPGIAATNIECFVEKYHQRLTQCHEKSNQKSVVSDYINWTRDRPLGGLLLGRCDIMRWITCHCYQPTVLIFNKIEQAEHKRERKQEKYAVYQILKARGKRRQNPIGVIPRVNFPKFLSEQVFFLNLRSTIESIRLYSMVNNKSYIAGNHSVQQFVNNEAVRNRPETVAVGDGGQPNTTYVRPTPTEFLLNCFRLDEPPSKCFGRDVHTGTQKVEQENDLIDRFILLKAILGRNPEFVELYDAGFIREEIDLLEFTLDDVQTQESLNDVEVVA